MAFSSPDSRACPGFRLFIAATVFRSYSGLQSFFIDTFLSILPYRGADPDIVFSFFFANITDIPAKPSSRLLLRETA